jgi:tetratricopeptide (TPR) repeat protein
MTEEAEKDAARNRRPVLSLCMIVRNEERFLAGCLDSVAGVVDEIVVVDTGSTDTTRDIVRRYGAIVLEAPWTGDFSAARNVSIAHAAGEWILALDADERLAPGQESYLRSLLTNLRYSAYTVLIRGEHYLPTGVTSQVNAYPRLFRRHPGIRYEGMVHEQIMPSLVRSGLQAGDSHLGIVHLGYGIDLETVRLKSRRNLELLRSQRIQDPEDPYVRFQIGNTLTILGEYDEAARELEAMLDGKSPPAGIRASAHNLLAEIDIRRGMFRAAREQCIESLKRAGNQITARWYLAASAAGERKFAEALKPLQEILRLNAHQGHERHGNIAHDIVLPDAAVHARIGLCQEGLGNTGLAESLYRKALQRDPGQQEAAEGLARIIEGRGASDGTLAELQALIRGGSDYPAVQTAAARILRSLGKRSEAYVLLSTYASQHPADSVAAAVEMVWHVHDGEFDAAEECYQKLAEHRAPYYDYHRAAVDLALHYGDGKRALYHLEELAKIPGVNVSAIKPKIEVLRKRLSAATEKV